MKASGASWPFAAGQEPVEGPLMTHKRDRGGGQTAEVCVCARTCVCGMERGSEGEGGRLRFLFWAACQIGCACGGARARDFIHNSVSRAFDVGSGGPASTCVFDIQQPCGPSEWILRIWVSVHPRCPRAGTRVGKKRSKSNSLMTNAQTRARTRTVAVVFLGFFTDKAFWLIAAFQLVNKNQLEFCCSPISTKAEALRRSNIKFLRPFLFALWTLSSRSPDAGCPRLVSRSSPPPSGLSNTLVPLPSHGPGLLPHTLDCSLSPSGLPDASFLIDSSFLTLLPLSRPHSLSIPASYLVESHFLEIVSREPAATGDGSYQRGEEICFQGL